MKKQLKSFSLTKFYVISAVLLVLPMLVALPINLLVFEHSFIDDFFLYLIGISLGYLVHIPIHEGVHALTAIILCRVSPRDVSFGVVKEQLMFYCHVDKPMTARLYRVVLIAPLMLLGVLPLILVTIFASPFLVILFSMCISGCAGDVVMYVETYKYHKSQLILDHPSAPAYYLLYDENNLPEDFREVTDEQEQELQDKLHKRH